MEQPKVRFSKSLETYDEQKNTEEINIASGKDKIKVKSIVSTNFPIKVLKNGKRVLIKDKKTWNNNAEISEQKKLKEKHSVPDIYIADTCDSLPASELKKLINVTESETLNVEYVEHQCHSAAEDERNDSIEIQNCTDELQAMTINKSISKSNSAKQTGERNNETEKNIPYINCDDSEDSDIEVIQVIKNNKKPKNVQKHIDKNKLNKSKTPQKENKENYSEGIKSNNIQNKLVASGSIKMLNDKTNAYSKKPENILMKKPIKAQKKLEVTPHAKLKTDCLTKYKVNEKLPKTQTKKSTVFNVAGNHCNISVEPGILQKKFKNNSNKYSKGDNQKSNIVFKDLLSHPEYNSTICIMKKLKEIEKEKLVTDLEHLPAAYKNLIHGKVSASLDFPPYESVYKNLINLSVDDDKLPARLTRTKDPEPRDKDIIPKLSNFYNPNFTEQYNVIVNPMTLNPINVNTLSAFTISNKICSWKICRDNF